MNSTNFKNRVTGEIVICDDPKNIKVIDDVEYFFVRRKNTPRQFLMRKDALIKEPLKNKSV